MGASWIHGTTGNPLTALAQELDIKVTPTSYQRSVALDDSGSRLDFTPAVDRAMALIERARARADRLDHDVPLQTAIEATPGWQALSAIERRLQRLAINTRIEHEYSGDWRQLSAWSFDDGKDFPGDQAVLTPGYGPIVAHLAKGLDIRQGCVVTAVAPTATGVEVTTQSGICRASHAIVTLPLGVLKSGSIGFAVPLNNHRQRAIESLGVGLLNKCCLRFDRVFWPADVDWIDHLGPVDTLWADWTSYLTATDLPLLVGFNAAAMADKIELLDDRATVASALSALRSMFGRSVPNPAGYQISRWRQDPFARGAYSFIAAGTNANDRHALFGSDWGGRLIFAGEATSADHPSTAHGALMTGRAAASILLGQTEVTDWT